MNPVRILSSICVFVCLSVGTTTQAEAKDDVPDFKRDVAPLLRSYCGDCHGKETQEADLRLDTISIDVTHDRRAAEIWHEVLGEVSSARMPPEDATQPSEQELETMTRWMRSTVETAIGASRRNHGRAVMRRLNRAEYQHTMQDLLGMEMDYSRDLPPDAISSDGFSNNGAHLQMTAFQLEAYLQTARRAMDRLIVSGPEPTVHEHRFTESKIDGWLGQNRRANRLGRFDEFLAKMKDDYPERGDFRVRVTVEAELKPDMGYPLLEVSVGYRPDTQILMREFDWVEIDSAKEQVLEFRGRLEEFPLPVRGQGKYPGLVVRVRNRYSDGSQLPELKRDDKKKLIYPEEDHLPKLNVKEVEFRGPVFTQWPPASHRRILFDSPLRETNEAKYVRKVLSRFMTRAFRRPVRRDELAPMMAHYRDIREQFPDLEETMREMLSLVLIQPGFLYLIEPAEDEERLVTDWELATRLSYFLWSTMPDRTLSKTASRGKLSEPTELLTQINRMLDDPRSNRMIERFVDGWLQVNRLASIAVDGKRYPGVDESLKQEFRHQTYSLFSEILLHNRSVLEFLDSDYAVLNESLARHYGIQGVKGFRPRPVPLHNGEHLGGLLAQASVMLVNSTGSDSHPIRRAVWIRDRLLDDPPSPPPPDVPTLEQADKKFHQLSIREQLEIHREKAACQSCHRNLDPWGIALENLDAVGRWRETLQTRSGNSHTINAKSRLPGDVEIDGLLGLKKHLVEERRDDFCRSLVRRLMSYSLGRELDLGDEPCVDRLVESLPENDYRMRDLMVQWILSPTFQTR